MMKQEGNPKPTICKECQHWALWTPQLPDTPHCKTNPETNYVTGEPEYESCRFKNNRGTCADYEAKTIFDDAPEMTVEEMAEDDRKRHVPGFNEDDPDFIHKFGEVK